MKDLGKCVLPLLIVSAIGIAFKSQAQLHDELIIMEEGGSIEQIPSTTIDSSNFWMLKMDISSPIAQLAGSQNTADFHYGIQLKHVRVANGFRFTTEFYPDIDAGFFSHSTREVAVVNDNIQYIDIYTRTNVLRFGFGYERRFKKDWGVSYIGMDYNWQRSVSSLLTNSYQLNVALNEIDSIQPAHHARTRGFGMGLSPLVGCEIPIAGGFGISVEIKADVALSINEGYAIDDEGIITKTGAGYYFRTFPLLNCRLHYQF